MCEVPINTSYLQLDLLILAFASVENANSALHKLLSYFPFEIKSFELQAKKAMTH